MKRGKRMTAELRSLRAENASLTARKEIERLKKDAILGQDLEADICMLTHFTGRPPYVGNKGLRLALRETVDRMKAAEARAAELQEQLDIRIDHEALASMKERMLAAEARAEALRGALEKIAADKAPETLANSMGIRLQGIAKDALNAAQAALRSNSPKPPEL